MKGAAARKHAAHEGGAATLVLLPSMKLVPTPRRAASVARLILVLLVALTIALLLTPWQQNISGSGRVVARTPVERQQTIAAPVEGRIVRWHVIEGAKVRKDSPVVDISDNDPAILQRLAQERSAVSDRLAAAKQREQSLVERIGGLEGSRQNALSAAGARIQMAAERVRAAERFLEAAEATVLTARLNLDRQTQLHGRGLASTRAVELATLDQAKATADVDRAKASLSAAVNDRQALEADRQKIETDFSATIDEARASRAGARAEIASAAASLQQMEIRIPRQNTQSIRAPRDGTILRLLAQPGSELLKAGDPLAILVPESSNRVVELWVKGNDMPLISPGNKVRLQFEGWPAIQFVGWPSVAVGTFGGEVALVDATDNGKGEFRLLVAPDPSDEPWPSDRWLRQGVRSHGWVLLNRVTLGFELWRQFNGFPPVIAVGEPGMVPDSGKEASSK